MITRLSNHQAANRWRLVTGVSLDTMFSVKGRSVRVFEYALAPGIYWRHILNAPPTVYSDELRLDLRQEGLQCG